jgi:drug/metabolite transporter (DMT)-like permease
MMPNRLGGVLLGILGVVVMDRAGSVERLTMNVMAQIAILGAAVCYACAGVFGRRFRSLPPMITATGQVTTATAMVLPLALFFDRPWAQSMPLMAAGVAVASAAVFCTALAYALYFRILATPGWFHASAATPPNRRSPRIAVAPEFCTTVPLREARDFAKACDFSEIA